MDDRHNLAGSTVHSRPHLKVKTILDSPTNTNGNPNAVAARHHQQSWKAKLMLFHFIWQDLIGKIKIAKRVRTHYMVLLLTSN